MIYRGQAYGEPAGEWWTSSREDAVSFAMSRGGNRRWVVLAIDENDTAWLERFVYATGCGDRRATWFRIPLTCLAERWLGARIVDGAITLGSQS